MLHETAKHYLSMAKECLNQKSEHYQLVEEFMQKHNQIPEVPSKEDRLLRAKLILEEALELVGALGVTASLDDGENDAYELTFGDLLFSVGSGWLPLEVIDGCCDLEYVTLGTMVACGFPDEAFFQDVHEANMTKPSEKNEDGKVQKNEHTRKPQTEIILQMLRKLDV